MLTENNKVDINFTKTVFIEKLSLIMDRLVLYI